MLRELIAETTGRGFVIDDLATEPIRQPADGDRDGLAMVEVTLHVHGRPPVSELAAALSDLEHVQAVLAADANSVDD